MRCLKAGRECLGYAAWQTIPYRPQYQSRSRTSTESPEQSILQLYQSNDEYRFFNFYTKDASGEIAGIIDEDFWTHLVPQLSFSNPAVRYSAIAIGSLLHRQNVRRSGALLQNSYPSEHDENGSALKYYSKALKATMTGVSASKDVHIALVTCILFFCVEVLQGHESEALELYHQGQLLLATIQKHRSDSSSIAASSTRMDSRLILMFSRLRVSAVLFGEHRSECRYCDSAGEQGSIASLEPFEDTTTARAVLSVLMADIHRFICYADRLKWVHHETSEMMHNLEFVQLEMKGRLQTWYHRFENLSQLSEIFEPSAAAGSSANKTLAAIAVLQCYRTTLFVWLSCILSRSECIYDQYLELFRQVTTLASQAIDLMLAQNNGVRPTFNFELGVIAPLYLVATRCRDPQLRRLAIRLLRKGPEQEGLWDAEKLAVVSERVVEIEERNLIPGEWPSEAKRVCETLNELRSSDNYGTKRNSCVFMTKPFGLDGEWEIWREWVL